MNLCFETRIRELFLQNKVEATEKMEEDNKDDSDHAPFNIINKHSISAKYCAYLHGI